MSDPSDPVDRILRLVDERLSWCRFCGWGDPAGPRLWPPSWHECPPMEPKFKGIEVDS